MESDKPEKEAISNRLKKRKLNEEVMKMDFISPRK